MLRQTHCSQRGRVAARCSHTACAVLQHPSCVGATAGTQQGRGMRTPCDCSTLCPPTKAARGCVHLGTATHTPPLPQVGYHHKLLPSWGTIPAARQPSTARAQRHALSHSHTQSGTSTRLRCCVAACQPLLACCAQAHTPNDLPHPQLSAALGLLNWKPPPIRASLQVRQQTMTATAAHQGGHTALSAHGTSAPVPFVAPLFAVCRHQPAISLGCCMAAASNTFLPNPYTLTCSPGACRTSTCVQQH